MGLGLWLSFQTQRLRRPVNYLIITERFSSVVCRISFEEGKGKEEQRSCRPGTENSGERRSKGKSDL